MAPLTDGIPEQRQPQIDECENGDDTALSIRLITGIEQSSVANLFDENAACVERQPERLDLRADTHTPFPMLRLHVPPVLLRRFRAAARSGS